MKSKIFLLLMLLSGLVLGQVPNNTTFNLQDVENNIAGTQGSLNQCFTDAVQSYFNATFKAQYYAEYGNLNNLLMFRDYGAHNDVLAPIYVNNGGVAETTGGTLTLTYPSGLSSGTNKRLFLFAMSRGLQLLSNLPSGWNLVTTSNTSNGHWSVYQKSVIGTESGSFGATLGASGNLTMGIVVCYEYVSNISSTNNINVSQWSGASTSLSTMTNNQLFTSFWAFMGTFNYSTTNGTIDVNVSSTTGTGGRIIIARQPYPSNNFSISFPYNYSGAFNMILEK